MVRKSFLNECDNLWSGRKFNTYPCLIAKVSKALFCSKELLNVLIITDVILIFCCFETYLLRSDNIIIINLHGREHLVYETASESHILTYNLIFETNKRSLCASHFHFLLHVWTDTRQQMFLKDMDYKSFVFLKECVTYKQNQQLILQGSSPLCPYPFNLWRRISPSMRLMPLS